MEVMPLKTGEDYYESSSWQSYRELCDALRRGKLNECEVKSGTYLPSPSEIRYRLEQMKWMVQKRLGDDIVDFVMYNDYPSFRVIQYIVKEYGSMGARRKIKLLIQQRRSSS